MRGHKLLLFVFLAAATGLPGAAQAQFSPRGLMGMVTRPFGAMLGRFGHFPHRHSSHMSARIALPRGAAAAATRQRRTAGMAERL